MVSPWRNVACSAVVCMLAAMTSGCGDGGVQERLDLAKQTVQTALDTWKRGEQAALLKAGPTPIEFFDDDWERAAKLIEYEIVKTYMETDGTPRCAVGLTVQYGKKPPAKVRATYQLVNKENRIVIGRDPFS